MAPKRRTSTPTGAARAQRAQSTLSFHKQGSNRIVKPGAQRDTKATKKNVALVDIIPTAQEPEAQPEEITTADAAIAEQAESVKAELNPLATGARKAEDVLGGRAHASHAGAVGGKAENGWQGDEETKARKISDTQIKKYWQAKERERKAPRVHQEGLTIREKLLREWDMSGQYGVSISATEPDDMNIRHVLTCLPAMHWNCQIEALEASKHAGPESTT